MNNSFRFLVAAIVFFIISILIGGFTLNTVAGAGIVSLLLAVVFKPLYETKEKSFFHGVDENKKYLPIILGIIFAILGGAYPFVLPVSALCSGPCFGAIYLIPILAFIGLIVGFFIGGVISLISSKK